KQQVRRRLQPFEAKRRLAFPGAKAERRRENRVDVCILHNERAAGEVRVEIELESARQPAPQVGTRATQGERVDHRVAGVFQREAAVSVEQQSHLQTEVTGG